jgi:glyoxylase-like metal-dependent hydrolase (beta-lactamase superfamily II)
MTISDKISSVSLRVETFVVGPFPNNLYLLVDEAAGEAVVVDPSIDSGEARARVHDLERDGIRLIAIWNTHGHLDHVYDNALWRNEFGSPIFIHRGDTFFLERLHEQSLWLGLEAPAEASPDHWLDDGQVLTVGSHQARVLHTPGHSPGSVSFLFDAEELCLSGDVLFRGSVGRTDLPGCSDQQLQESLAKLCALPSATRILPGHYEPTTIDIEIKTNPFCRQLAGPPEENY